MARHLGICPGQRVQTKQCRPKHQEVQRADGSVVFTETTGDTTLTLREPAGVLPESDYRWWVREDTDGSEPRASSFRFLRLRR